MHDHVISAEAEPDRSARKRAAIVDAATVAFLQDGFRGTSMDSIARAADVAKQTVYQHFGDKERLFTEVIGKIVDEAADPVSTEIEELGTTDDLASELNELALRQLRAVLRPRVLALRRLVIAESGRFPELGRAFYDQGPGRTVTALAAKFDELSSDGRLQLNDPSAAAAEFNWAMMAVPLNEAMLLGRTTFSDHELRPIADRAVTTFLRSNGPANA